jgi:hypothetical protein
VNVHPLVLIELGLDSHHRGLLLVQTLTRLPVTTLLTLDEHGSLLISAVALSAI